MKTFVNSLGILLLVISISSCSKEEILQSPSKGTSIKLAERTSLSLAKQSTLSTAVTDDIVTEQGICTSRTYPIYIGGTGTAGTANIKTDFNNRTIIRILPDAQWKILSVRVFAGRAADLPLTTSGRPDASLFTRETSFDLLTAPSTTSLVIDSSATELMISARIVLVKISKTGDLLETHAAWINGSAGDSQNEEDGSSFLYVNNSCPLREASWEDVITCSKEVLTVFGKDRDHNVNIPWSTPVVMAGGFQYSETEARAIGAGGLSSNTQDGRFVFTRYVTVLESSTNIALSAALTDATATVEAWLLTQAKFSSSNIPTPPANVVNAALTIDNWIDGHICSGRRLINNK